MLNRFHTLVSPMESVRAASSRSLKWRAASSHTSSGTGSGRSAMRWRLQPGARVPRSASVKYGHRASRTRTAAVPGGKVSCCTAFGRFVEVDGSARTIICRARRCNSCSWRRVSRNSRCGSLSETSCPGGTGCSPRASGHGGGLRWPHRGSTGAAIPRAAIHLCQWPHCFNGGDRRSRTARLYRGRCVARLKCLHRRPSRSA
jgi:hypothetical protein